MMKYPIRDRKTKMSNLNNIRSESVVVSDIAFRTAILYSVGCESGVRRWN